jgi:hypothetical protein
MQWTNFGAARHGLLSLYVLAIVMVAVTAGKSALLGVGLGGLLSPGSGGGMNGIGLPSNSTIHFDTHTTTNAVQTAIVGSTLGFHVVEGIDFYDVAGGILRLSPNDVSISIPGLTTNTQTPTKWSVTPTHTDMTYAINDRPLIQLTSTTDAATTNIYGQMNAYDLHLVHTHVGGPPNTKLAQQTHIRNIETLTHLCLSETLLKKQPTLDANTENKLRKECEDKAKAQTTPGANTQTQTQPIGVSLSQTLESMSKLLFLGNKQMDVAVSSASKSVGALINLNKSVHTLEHTFTHTQETVNTQLAALTHTLHTLQTHTQTLQTELEEGVHTHTQALEEAVRGNMTAHIHALNVSVVELVAAQNASGLRTDMHTLTHTLTHTLPHTLTQLQTDIHTLNTTHTQTLADLSTQLHTNMTDTLTHLMTAHTHALTDLHEQTHTNLTQSAHTHKQALDTLQTDIEKQLLSEQTDRKFDLQTLKARVLERIEAVNETAHTLYTDMSAHTQALNDTLTTRLDTLTHTHTTDLQTLNVSLMDLLTHTHSQQAEQTHTLNDTLSAELTQLRTDTHTALTHTQHTVNESLAEVYTLIAELHNETLATHTHQLAQTHTQLQHDLERVNASCVSAVDDLHTHLQATHTQLTQCVDSLRADTDANLTNTHIQLLCVLAPTLLIVL